MSQAADPSRLTAEERRSELARILARGLLRLCRGVRRSPAPDSNPKELSESPANCLEDSPETRLSVTRRVDDSRGPTESS
jgi:hypothetical protein